ncbi:MAG: helix-turn-helix domain-containing protein [Pseudomonadota bacterium]|jgi:transcriptional regulator GlxA family with amidase domain
MRRIVLIAFPGVQILDVTGPASVFGAVAEARLDLPTEILVASIAGGPVRASCGVDLFSLRLADIDPASVDMFLVAGGAAEGLQALCADPEARDWARTASLHAQRYGSVCTGAYAIADWGLAEGRRIATHWAWARRLQRRHPELEVDAKSLWVEAGRLWTSAGVTAGIDMCLAMAERDAGMAVAAQVAKRLVLPLRRSGNQAQYSEGLAAQYGGGGRYAELIAWIEANLAAALDAPRLAERAGESERSFQRHFRAAVGKGPAAFVAERRLERARALLEEGASVKATALACGYRAPERLSRAFAQAYGVNPASYRRPSQSRPARTPEAQAPLQ